MYRALQSHPTNRNSHQTQQFLKKIQSRSKRNMASFSHFFHNDLELILNKKYIDLKKKLLEYGANYVGMSGAGPTVFAIFKDRKKQKKAYQILKKRVSFITQTSTIP